MLNQLLDTRVGKGKSQNIIKVELEFGRTGQKTRGGAVVTNPWNQNWGILSEDGLIWINPWVRCLRRAYLKIISERASAVLIFPSDIPAALREEILRNDPRHIFFDDRWRNCDRQEMKNEGLTHIITVSNTSGLGDSMLWCSTEEKIQRWQKRRRMQKRRGTKLGPKI